MLLESNAANLSKAEIKLNVNLCGTISLSSSNASFVEVFCDGDEPTDRANGQTCVECVFHNRNLFKIPASISFIFVPLLFKSQPKLNKVRMVCLGFKPGAAEWLVQTKLLSCPYNHNNLPFGPILLFISLH